MQVEKYATQEDFFEAFDGDTFGEQETLQVDGKDVGWIGYVDGEIVAGFDYTSMIGWTIL